MPTDKRVDTARLLDTPSGLGDAARYAMAASMVMLATLAASYIVALPAHEVDTVSDAASAVMIDLPPAAASAPGQSGSEAADQEAAAAAPPAQEQPIEERTMRELPVPVPQQPQAPAPTPPPVADNPAAVIERAAPPPRPNAEATPPPQDAQATAGSDTPSTQPVVADEMDRPQVSAHALTQWQKAMATRLQAAKRSAPRHAGGSGTVQIAFAIDRNGRVVSEKVDRTSGDPSLDAAASALVRRAAPFPAPPPGAREADLAFTVPIRFRQ